MHPEFSRNRHDRSPHAEYRKNRYAGPRGSWTPLHHDVMYSYSWSVNICGRKRWVFFRPEDTPALHTVLDIGEGDASSISGRMGGGLVPDVRPWLFPPVEAKSSSPSSPSMFRMRAHVEPGCPPPLRAALRRALVAEQGVGEALFVPSGWHHQVGGVVPAFMGHECCSMFAIQ